MPASFNLQTMAAGSKSCEGYMVFCCINLCMVLLQERFGLIIFTLDLLSCLLFAVIPPQLSLLIAQSIYHYIGAAQAATLQGDNGSTLVYTDPVLCPPLGHHICMFTCDSEHCTASPKSQKHFLRHLLNSYRHRRHIALHAPLVAKDCCDVDCICTRFRPGKEVCL